MTYPYNALWELLVLWLNSVFLPYVICEISVIYFYGCLFQTAISQCSLHFGIHFLRLFWLRANIGFVRASWWFFSSTSDVEIHTPAPTSFGCMVLLKHVYFLHHQNVIIHINFLSPLPKWTSGIAYTHITHVDIIMGTKTNCIHLSPKNSVKFVK